MNELLDRLERSLVEDLQKAALTELTQVEITPERIKKRKAKRKKI
jgi:hypothetical protein